jgi:hypothetical protein
MQSLKAVKPAQEGDASLLSDVVKHCLKRIYWDSVSERNISKENSCGG